MSRRPPHAAWLLATLAAGCLLAGCANPPDVPPSPPKAARLAWSEVALEVRFPPGGAIPAAGELERLDATLAAIPAMRANDAQVRADRPGLPPALAEARRRALVRHLAGRGIAVAPPSAAIPQPPAAEPGTATVLMQRPVAVVPGCPDWRKPLSGDFTNTPSSNFGCADAANLALMLADPRDLERGREVGPADGEAAVLGIQRYRKGEIRTDNPLGSKAMPTLPGLPPAGGK